MRRFGAGGVGLRAFEPARQLHRRQLPQLRRQRGQGDLAERALVVARRESHQTSPGGIQRRQSIQCAQHRFGVFGGQAAAVRQRFPDHAQHLAAAQRHAHQLAGRQWQLTSVSQWPADAAVGRGGHHNAQPKTHVCVDFLGFHIRIRL